eukprot:3806160-Pleurochrysis_carterae.AAC.1
MGERLGRLIIKFLPTALAGEGRALLRELIDKKLLGNEGRVIEVVDTMRLLTVLMMVHCLVPVSAAHKSCNKKGKKAIAAAAATRKTDSSGGAGGGAPGGRPPYELPDGQWCSKRTCHLTHDKVNPRGPCYRDPSLSPTKYCRTNNKSNESRTHARIMPSA